MCRFKYENVVFMALVIMYIIGLFERDCNLMSNLITFIMQVLMCVGIRSLLKYVRKNATEIKKAVSDMLTD